MDNITFCDCSGIQYVAVAPLTRRVHCERGLEKVISASPLFAEVVQADFDQCGSMWMSVQPEGAM